MAYIKDGKIVGTGIRRREPIKRIYGNGAYFVSNGKGESRLTWYGKKVFRVALAVGVAALANRASSVHPAPVMFNEPNNFFGSGTHYPMGDISREHRRLNQQWYDVDLN